MTRSRKPIPVMATDLPVDIIWNFTLVCPFNCKKCCVAATHVEVRDGNIHVRNGDLSELEVMKFDRSKGSPYAQVAQVRQEAGLELDLAARRRVLDHLEGVRPKIDLSGGEVLVHPDALTIMREASERFGASQITMTATGPGLHLVNPEDLKPYIGELNFTYDGVPPVEDPNCPPNYSRANLLQASRFAEAGIPVRAELPLTLQNIDAVSLETIFEDLHEAKIPKLLLMRLFAVGRGQDRWHQVPSPEQYTEAIRILKQLEETHGSPKVKLQCALKRHAGVASGPNPCDAMRESFGLMSDGTLLGSPWAIDKHGRPLDDIWVLGNLAEQSMVEILASPRVARLREQIAEADLDEEGEAFGQCKIQSFIYGESADPLERMFEAADPLYSPQLSRGAADIADTEHGDPEHGDPENGGAAHDDAARDNAAENHAAA